MGRSKPKQKPPPKKWTGTLDAEFTCPFCNHPKACEAKMNRARGKAVISCSVRFEAFQAPITHLSDPVAVCNAWVDACEEANREQPQRSARGLPPWYNKSAFNMVSRIDKALRNSKESNESMRVPRREERRGTDSNDA
ncbi:transcription elongation factor 1 homolog [Tenrec ecaudatus]|uniref:transcription elongation factor 1 homolog n=1 Tax=Tenrec ecaudatus TaxID=94439 RepID=UPI003F597B43